MLIRKCWNLTGWIMEVRPFPYRWSGPLDQSKTHGFWEDGGETIDRGREKLLTFGKLSVNFRNFSGKT